MNLILDQFGQPSVFRPGSIPEAFALRLAQKLNETAAVRHYVQLAAQFPEAQLLAAYRRTRLAHPGVDLGRRFHVELEHSKGNGTNGLHVKLLALRVERRAVAAAVFYGDHLEYTDVRQLSSIRGKAMRSAVNFLGWLLGQFAIESAAVENIGNGHEILRHALSDALVELLRDRMLPIWEVSKRDLFSAFGQPPLHSRKATREVICSIWPVLAGTNSKVFIQDAAALGLYVQQERLFLP